MKFRTTPQIIVIGFFALVTAIGHGAQNEKKPASCCQRIDNTHNSIYILFERAGFSTENKINEPFVWLRLRNNTTCSFSLLAEGFPYFFDGKYRCNAIDGEEIAIYYEFQKDKTREYYKYRDSFAVVKISAGISVIFKVPAKFFKDKRLVCVPIEYEWEIGDIRHEVLFHTDMLPRDWEKAFSAPDKF